MAFLLLLRLLPPLRLIEDIDDGWDDEKACTASIENGNDDCAPLRRQRLPPVDDDDEDDDAKSTIIAAIAEDERLFFISGVRTKPLARVRFDFLCSFGPNTIFAHPLKVTKKRLARRYVVKSLRENC